MSSLSGMFTCLPSLSVNLGPLSRPDGSASFTYGRVCVLSGVYGPADVRPNKELVDAAYVSVSFSSSSGPSSVRDHAKEELLSRAFRSAIITTSYPRTAVNISVQVLDDDTGDAEDFQKPNEDSCDEGAIFAMCINSVTLALADAAVDMRYLLAAITVGVDAEGVVKMLTSTSETRKCSCVVTHVFESVDQQVVMSHFEKGKCSERQFQEMLATARDGSKHFFNFYRSAIRKKFSKYVQF